jgi:hypothetical protein
LRCLIAEEGTDSTAHEKVFIARLGSRWESGKLDERLERLREVVERGTHDEMVALLRELVPSYRPSESASPSDFPRTDHPRSEGESSRPYRSRRRTTSPSWGVETSAITQFSSASI